MRVNKWQWTALAFTLLLLGGAQASQAFDFGGLLKELEKPKTPPASESGQDPAAEPARKEQDGGLLGLGESLGLIDKKSSDLLKGSVSTLKAFQPIGYEEERAIGGSPADLNRTMRSPVTSTWSGGRWPTFPTGRRSTTTSPS